MTTFFIADIHLSDDEPAISAGFLRFLAAQARTASALYILGDLFDAWIGDDNLTPLHQQIASAIRALTDAGVPCFFIHGNRDFLLGERYASLCNMRLLPEQLVLELHGHKVLIMHGDTLCTDDPGYLAFRKKVHQPWLQKLYLALPLIIRKLIARQLRAGSQAANQRKDVRIMDVNANAVITALEQHQLQHLIHGHTHRPAVHQLEANKRPAFRYVLGAWHHQGSVIKVSDNGIELIFFPF